VELGLISGEFRPPKAKNDKFGAGWRPGKTGKYLVRRHDVGGNITGSVILPILREERR